mmetsp:Transcript_25410/g.61211  ORF Transcript_25410/g.61211 Transcript_25410/m.61211 type:complete len:210 (+) Transcript_25410:2228-2857(+)
MEWTVHASYEIISAINYWDFFKGHSYFAKKATHWMNRPFALWHDAIYRRPSAHFLAYATFEGIPLAIHLFNTINNRHFFSVRFSVRKFGFWEPHCTSRMYPSPFPVFLEGLSFSRTESTLYFGIWNARFAFVAEPISCWDLLNSVARLMHGDIAAITKNDRIFFIVIRAETHAAAFIWVAIFRPIFRPFGYLYVIIIHIRRNRVRFARV